MTHRHTGQTGQGKLSEYKDHHPGRPENSGSTLRKKAVKEQKIEKVEKIYKIVIDTIHQ